MNASADEWFDHARLWERDLLFKARGLSGMEAVSGLHATNLADWDCVLIGGRMETETTLVHLGNIFNAGRSDMHKNCVQFLDVFIIVITRTLLVVSLFVFTIAKAHAREEALQIEAPSSWSGWKQGTGFEQGPMRVTEFWPKGQDINSWQESIMISHIGTRPPGDKFLDVVRTRFVMAQGACETLNVTSPEVKNARGFSVAYGRVFCSKERTGQTGRIEFMKIIASETRIYFVVFSRRVPMFEIPLAGAFTFNSGVDTKDVVEWMKTANTYLTERVYVCSDPAFERDACSQ